MSALASTLAAAPAGTVLPSLPPPPSPATGGAPAQDAFSLSALCRSSNNNNNNDEDEGASSPPPRAKIQAGIWASHARPQEDDMEDSEDEEGSGVASAAESEEDASQEEPTYHSPAPKRNKRKNFKPRNILYSMDDDGEGENGGDNPPLDLTEGVPAKRRSTILPRRLERSEEARRHDAMDLSVRGSDEERGSVEEALMAQQYAHLQSQLQAHLATLQHCPELLGLGRDPGDIRDLLLGRAGAELHGHPGDASAMREYAESTMKELLGIYGLNDLAESITKHVPIANFASGKCSQFSPRNNFICCQTTAGQVTRDYTKLLPSQYFKLILLCVLSKYCRLQSKFLISQLLARVNTTNFPEEAQSQNHVILIHSM